MSQEKGKFWKYFQRFGGFVAIIASIIGVYYQLETKDTKLELRLLSVNHLTANSNVDNLSSDYKYKGIPVKNLWLVKYELNNTGENTIIGTGEKSNIIGDKLSFKFLNKVEILDNIEVQMQNLPINISVRDSISFSVYFDQWRTTESCQFYVYLKSDTIVKDFLPHSVNRPLIDGEILIKDSIKNPNQENKPVIDRFANPIPIVGRIVSIIVILAILVIIISIFIEIFGEGFKYLKWKKSNMRLFQRFIEDIKHNPENYNVSKVSRYTVKYTLEEIKKQPWLLNSDYWEYFNGEKLDVSYPDIISYKSLVYSILLFFLCLSVVAVMGCVVIVY